jgi:hypothetical protein
MMSPMRWLAPVVLVALAVIARADDFHAYDGQIIISPDPVPTVSDQLPAFLTANATKDGHYELIKGPPWRFHLIGFLAKDPGTTPVKLVFVDGDKPLQTSDVSSKRKIVVASTTATVEAGFEANKTYGVRLVAGTTVLAKAELRLRN